MKSICAPERFVAKLQEYGSGRAAVLESIGLRLICLLVLSGVSLVGGETPPQQHGDVSKWATFLNKSGWSIKYPTSMKIGSCRQCSDPTNPDVLVTFTDSSVPGSLIIERLADKPTNETVDKWLSETSRDTVANSVVDEEWMYLDGMPTLKVRNRGPGLSESENLYVAYGSKTFAIRASGTQDKKFYRLYLQMRSTFRFHR